MDFFAGFGFDLFALYQPSEGEKKKATSLIKHRLFRSQIPNLHKTFARDNLR